MNASKQQILQGALRCFIEKGVEHTSIADIRDSSGISVGSIYHHFGNKDGIVVALFLAGMQDHEARQIAALETADSAEAGVKAIVRCYIDWICEHPDWARFVFRSRTLVENSAQAHLNREQKKAHFLRLKEWFAPHMEQGTLRRLPFEAYHALLIGPAQDFAQRWLAGITRNELAEFRELFAQAAWQAVKVQD